MRHLIDYSDDFALRVTPTSDMEVSNYAADATGMVRSFISNVTDFVPMDMLGLPSGKVINYNKVCTLA